MLSLRNYCHFHGTPQRLVEPLRNDLRYHNMTRAYRNDLFVRAARGERTPRTPAWLMRQAGRTDPAYMALRAEADLPLEDLFRNPELAARISLLPKRLGVDAIIYFQDILTPLAPMGAEFLFRPGPVLEKPIRTIEQIRELRTYDVASELRFIEETFRLVGNELDGEMPVLGFAGAPLTLAVFLIEGRSFGDEAPYARDFFANHVAETHHLLERLTSMTIDYLKYQIDAGAAAVQLFESAAHLLTNEQYETLALPYQQQVFEALRDSVPTIVFAREWDDLAALERAGADIISLPSSVSIAEARAQLGEDKIFQGNLDNHLLATGTLEEIEAATRDCVASGDHRGHIFNLSHGLLRETPYENIQHMMEVVRVS